MNKLASIIALLAVAGTLEACEGHLSPFIKKAPSIKGQHKNGKRQRIATASLKDLCLKQLEKSLRNPDIDQQEFMNSIAQSLPNNLLAELYNKLYSAKTASGRGPVNQVELISPRKAAALTPERSARMLKSINQSPAAKRTLHFDNA